MDPVPPDADAVVIGAGPAGAAVARGLADAGHRVVVIEAGAGGPRPDSLLGLDLVAAAEEHSRHWPGLLVRDDADGSPRPYRQGRGLGGGSMINGMLLTPGDRADYRRWAGERGCVGWGPDDLAPWLDRARAAYPSRQLDPGPVSQALATAAADDGLPVGGTSLDQDRLGVLRAELSAVDGRRFSAADAHLDGDGTRPGGVRRLVDGALTIVTGRAVDRVTSTAEPGVHDVVLAGSETIRTRQVVVCAGALATPALLLRSELSRRPIGRVLVDHPSFAFTLVLRPRADLDQWLAAVPPVVSRLIRWSSGPQWRGDLQAIAIDRVARPAGGGPNLAVVAVGLMAVTAEGSVTLPRPDLGPDGLDVVTGLLGTADDRARLRAGVRRVARWLRSPPFDDLVEAVHLDERGRPLDQIDAMADAELDRLLASRPGPYAHPAGTCPLGPADRARSVTAIDVGRFGQLLDRPGLRVADASVFPGLVRGGLQLPVAAVAARIADDIIASG